MRFFDQNLPECLSQIDNLISQGRKFLQNDTRKISRDSKNLDQVYDSFTKIEENMKLVQRNFIKFSKKMSQCAKKIKKWTFVDEAEWKSWDSSVFVKFVFQSKLEIFKNFTHSFQKTLKQKHFVFSNF